MSKEIKYRTGIDDRPITREEAERLMNGGSLYQRITAPLRTKDTDIVGESKQNPEKIA
jgi:hypothetical protein